MPRWFYLAILNLISLIFGDGSRPSHAFTNKKATASEASAAHSHACKRTRGGAVRVRARLCVAGFPQGSTSAPGPIRRAPPSRGVPRGTPHPRARRHQSWEHHFQRVVDFLCFPQDLRARSSTCSRGSRLRSSSFAAFTGNHMPLRLAISSTTRRAFRKDLSWTNRSMSKRKKKWKRDL